MFCSRKLRLTISLILLFLAACGDELRVDTSGPIDGEWALSKVTCGGEETTFSMLGSGNLAQAEISTVEINRDSAVRRWVVGTCRTSVRMSAIQYVSGNIMRLTDEPMVCEGACGGISGCNSSVRIENLDYKYQVDSSGSLHVTLAKEVTAAAAAVCGNNQDSTSITLSYRKKK